VYNTGNLFVKLARDVRSNVFSGMGSSLEDIMFKAKAMPDLFVAKAKVKAKASGLRGQV